MKFMKENWTIETFKGSSNYNGNYLCDRKFIIDEIEISLRAME